MARRISVLLLISTAAFAGNPQYNEWFANTTLRIDYYHTGTATTELYSLDALYEEGQWPGRRTLLLDTLNVGSNLACVYDQEKGTLIFSTSYCTVFNEWQSTTEAIAENRRTMHETIRIPMPLKPIRLEIKRRDRQNHFIAGWSVDINPISRSINREKNPYSWQVHPIEHHGDPDDQVDIVILGDGYSRDDLGKLRADAERYSRVLFNCEPFKSRLKDFNVWLIESVSAESGIDEPDRDLWRSTAVGASYNTFDTPRYVLTMENRDMRDIAALAPYDVIYILFNSPRYGGGGIYNQFATCYTGAENGEPEWWSDYVFVHEFGHSFAALADEYYTSDVAYNNLYPLDVEPWEVNITTLNAAGGPKWSSLLTPQVKIPTPWHKEQYDSLSSRAYRYSGDASQAKAERDAARIQMENILVTPDCAAVVGCFEGAGYASSGIYRSAINCRMFSKSLVEFCPVCRKAIEEMISFSIGK